LIIQENVSLADKNWFNTGGCARFFTQPTTVDEVTAACKWAHNHHQRIFIIGHGANILVNDAGFDGLLLRPQLQDIAILQQNSSETLISTGAGVSMDLLIEWCIAHNLLGLEEFSGIPGTVGGSVYINLHYYQFLLEHFLHSALVLEIETGTIMTVSREWFKFSYNQSALQEKNHILLQADIEIAYARGRRVEIIRHRAARYPTKNTCGSFFRNFYENEVTLVSGGKKMIYVAYYLDKIGVKGTLSIGGALVSHQHANMIVNVANATTDHIITLARTMQKLVHDNFGIIPRPECQIVGFENNPLL
jgi:UDP-N-acetylmuramate dehydrogenase